MSVWQTIMSNGDLLLALFGGGAASVGVQALLKSFANVNNARGEVMLEKADAQDTINKSHSDMLTHLHESMRDVQTEIKTLRQENKKLIVENYEMKLQLVKMVATIRDLRRDLDDRDRVIERLSTRLTQHKQQQNKRNEEQDKAA